MISLTERQHDLLSRIRNAEPQGYAIRQGELADCLHMGIHGLVSSPTTSEPQRVVITQRGRAFVYRVAA